MEGRNMARGLKFHIKKVEGLYNLCSKNKDADQLHGHCEADLRLCFHIYAKSLFSYDTALMIFRSAKMWAVTLYWNLYIYMGYTRDNSHTYFL